MDATAYATDLSSVFPYDQPCFASLPSPRTWHATRPCPSVCAPPTSDVSLPDNLDADVEELAESIAQYCISDEVSADVSTSYYSTPLRRLVQSSELDESPISLPPRSFNSGSWISAASSEASSRSASPTSVLRESTSPMHWETLFAAAEQAQRDAHALFPEHKAQRGIQQALRRSNLSPQRTSASPVSTYQGIPSRMHSTPPKGTAASTRQPAFSPRIQHPSAAPPGTGVFLPRVVPSITPGKSSSRKAAPVILPERLVKAFNLNVDDHNNVVLGTSGGSCHMKVVREDRRPRPFGRKPRFSGQNKSSN